MMSRALPAATPPNTSNSTTSPSSLSPIRWARVPPILPAPIRAILLRAILSVLTAGKGTAIQGIAARRVPGGPEGVRLLAHRGGSSKVVRCTIAGRVEGSAGDLAGFSAAAHHLN